MKPLLVLLDAFIVSIVSLKLFSKEWNYLLAGNIAMTTMLLFTAVGHFAFTKGMTMMLPNFVPFKKELVYLTGVTEVVAAIGLLISSFRTVTAILLILFFILLLPANIYAAFKRVDYQKGTYDGQGSSYLWFRVPLQLLFIAWV
ncbi:DoxX family protein [Spirosoma arcticum]